MHIVKLTSRARQSHWVQSGASLLALLIGQFMSIGSAAAMGLKIEPTEVQCGTQTQPKTPAVAMPAGGWQ